MYPTSPKFGGENNQRNSAICNGLIKLVLVSAETIMLQSVQPSASSARRPAGAADYFPSEFNPNTNNNRSPRPNERQTAGFGPRAPGSFDVISTAEVKWQGKQLQTVIALAAVHTSATGPFCPFFWQQRSLQNGPASWCEPAH